jgi:hypothetical protein
LIDSGVELFDFAEATGSEFDFAVLIDEKMGWESNVNFAGAVGFGVFQQNIESVGQNIVTEAIFFQVFLHVRRVIGCDGEKNDILSLVFFS